MQAFEHALGVADDPVDHHQHAGGGLDRADQPVSRISGLAGRIEARQPQPVDVIDPDRLEEIHPQRPAQAALVGQRRGNLADLDVSRTVSVPPEIARRHQVWPVLNQRHQHFARRQFQVEPDFERIVGQFGWIGDGGDVERHRAIAALPRHACGDNPCCGERTGEMIVRADPARRPERGYQREVGGDRGMAANRDLALRQLRRRSPDRSQPLGDAHRQIEREPVVRDHLGGRLARAHPAVRIEPVHLEQESVDRLGRQHQLELLDRCIALVDIEIHCGIRAAPGIDHQRHITIKRWHLIVRHDLDRIVALLLKVVGYEADQREIERHTGAVAQPQFAADTALAIRIHRGIESQRRARQQALGTVRVLERIDEIDLAGIELRLRIRQRQQAPPARDMGHCFDQSARPRARIRLIDSGKINPVIAPGQGQRAAAGGQREAVVFVLRADQLGDHPAIVVECLLHGSPFGRVTVEAQPQRRFGQRGQRGEITLRRIGREIGHDIAFGPAHPGDLRGADGFVGTGLERERQRGRFVRTHRQPGNCACRHAPLLAETAHDIGLAPDFARAAEKPLPAIEPADCLELRALRRLVGAGDVLGDPGPGARKQFGVGQIAIGLAQHLIQRFGEDPAAVVEVFLRRLVAVAPGQQHVAGVRHLNVAGFEHAGVLPLEVGFQLAREIAVGRAADPGPAGPCQIAGATARMAAIEHPGDVRVVLCQFRQQQRQLLVGKVEVVADPAVVTDQPLIAPAQVEPGEFGRSSGARAVAAVVQVGDIVLTRLPQMFAHLGNDIGISRVGVVQRDDRRVGAVGFEKVRDVGSIGKAAFERLRASRIAIYPDQQRIDSTHLLRLSQSVRLRPVTGLLSCFEGKVKGLSEQP